MDTLSTDPESGFAGAQPVHVTAYRTQANALFRKNLTYQKRNWRVNGCLVCVPFSLCILLVAIQLAINHVLSGSDYECGCECVSNANGPGCTKVCGLQYSDENQAGFCAVPDPQGWPAILQVPRPEYRIIQSANSPDLLADATCREGLNCGTTVFYTGSNKTVSDSMANYLLSTNTLSSSINTLSGTAKLYPLASVVLGSDTLPWGTFLLESAFTSPGPVYNLEPNCSGSSPVNLTVNISDLTVTKDFSCLETQLVWRNNASLVNDELYTGYRDGNPGKQINEVPVAYDFGTTSAGLFDVKVWYNSTYQNQTAQQPPQPIRISRSLNMASEAFLRLKQGPLAQLPLIFVKDMPKPSTALRLDFSSLLGPIFYMWILGFVFPVVLTAMVYEKENNLRIMMKMHGLGDKPYWTISYIYYLCLFTVYMFCFILFGSVIGLNFFRKNSYSIQVVFFFLYINMIISFGFLASNLFRDVKTARVVGYLYVFGTGLLSSFFFQNFVVDLSISRKLVTALEIIPAFATYRGLYELAQYAFQAVYTDTKGMQWSNLKDKKNGMKQVLVILFVEWIVFMTLTLYLDQVAASQSGLNKHPLFFLNFKRKSKKQGAAISSSKLSTSSKALARMNFEDRKATNRADVAQEKELVDELRLNPSNAYPIVCDDLKRVYPARDGNPPKYAVRGFSLAVPRGECFGILGPNGAGKTSSINMMIGFMKPTAGTAYIQGMNIQTEIDRIYSCMGVCPQHDLLWGQLTGREHLLFYGRLKNLKGTALTNAVESSLRSVNLFDNGVADKQCRRYSGGMKRRLSVAISLIGNPQVVYMDEPSTGLDPASRYNLWNVVKQSKQDRAIILTTHSMEEAEALCDRLGIFVNGELQCIGNAKELTARFGGLYMLTITTPQEEEAEVVNLAMNLTPNAKKVYGLSGTQKFELPKAEVSIANVFTKVEQAKKRLHIQAWGLSDTTLEDVFIKVARQASGGVQLS